jgi:FtsP/CotA-like multicopper oxidase with cupredoxin domain
MVTRRTFIKHTAAGGFGLYLWGGRAGSSAALAQAAPGHRLDPLQIAKYVTPLLIPPAMPRAGRIARRGGKNIDYYEIAVRQFSQQILPAGMPPTTVWGYGPAAARRGAAIFHAPSLTIEAKYDTPVRIRWTNELVDEDGNSLPHLLAVDQTLHWANPPGGAEGRDMRPVFENTPDRYTGPVPIVTHVHGAIGVGDESDGYAEAWFLPAAKNIPDGYATEGKWYQFFRAKAAAKGFVAPGTTGWEAGSAVFEYPNAQRASTIWYHDHTLGMTRLNVYAGPAGFYIVRGGPDDDVRELGGGLPATLPGPAARAAGLGDQLGRVYEVPIAIQDRSFNTDGSLFYPDSRTFFDGITGPFVPDTDVSPIWNPEFFGNCVMVNGNTWPFLEVEQRRYRFRVLNGCNARFLILDFGSINGVDVWQIGNEGGFLASPVDVTGMRGNRILLAPAERADVIVDFTNVPLGAYSLLNVGPDEPFGGGEPGIDFTAADPDTTGQLLQFRVKPIVGVDRSTPPQMLRLPPIVPLAGGAPRSLALLEKESETFPEPAEALLGTVAFDESGVGTWSEREWHHVITENPQVGDTEVWEFYNMTVDAHPIHVHELLFQVIDRQPIVIDEDNQQVRLAPASSPRSPEPAEMGWKDTVIAYPAEVTRVRLRFETAGQYVWHCHIVEHEDNEMMRPYRIGPAQDGQPG